MTYLLLRRHLATLEDIFGYLADTLHFIGIGESSLANKFANCLNLVPCPKPAVTQPPNSISHRRFMHRAQRPCWFFPFIAHGQSTGSSGVSSDHSATSTCPCLLNSRAWPRLCTVTSCLDSKCFIASLLLFWFCFVLFIIHYSTFWF